jgi:hypothetical protein
MTEPDQQNPAPEPAPAPEPPKTEPDKGPDLAAEVEKWKAQARKHEAESKANRAAAAKLAEFEDRDKTEAQRLADRVTAAEERAAQAEARAVRFEIAAEFGLSQEDSAALEHVPTEDGMRAVAQSLARKAATAVEEDAERKRRGNFVSREGHSPDTNDTDAAALAILGFG